MSKKFCEWARNFDDNFSIDCGRGNNRRANGDFKPDEKILNTKWNFLYCPYCGKEIKIIGEG